LANCDNFQLQAIASPLSAIDKRENIGLESNYVSRDRINCHSHSYKLRYPHKLVDIQPLDVRYLAIRHLLVCWISYTFCWSLQHL